MKTVDIDEKSILKTVAKKWATVNELAAALGVTGSAKRKISAIVSVLKSMNKLESRIRHLPGRGRPPLEFKKAPGE